MLKLNKLLKKLILNVFFRTKGESIFDKEWDNLIILDACRYDVFEEVIKEFNINYGKLEKHISLGSDTTEFLRKNFEEKHDDIVYIAANPFVSIILKEKVYKIVPVWKYGWDEKLKTVTPIYVYYYTIKEYLNNFDKRFIIHFMQPHHPYISFPEESMQKAVEMQRLEALYGTNRNFTLKINLHNIFKVIIERKIYPTKFYIEIDLEKHKKAYKENLKIVLPYALRLAKLLPGLNVITADHGEAFGERISPLIPIRVYGHLPEVHVKPLVEVPWYVVPNYISKEEALARMREELELITKEILRRKASVLREKLMRSKRLR